MDEQKINGQLDDISSLINNGIEPTIDDNIQDINYMNKDDFNTTKRRSNYVSPYYINYSRVIEDLLKINGDTVGWLRVNNTKIDYPVVQNKDNNSYYLNRDFRQNKNSMGWIFMDYRNNPDNLDKNTIIYGHNIKTGIMFGTLKNTLSSSWYRNKDNHIISFNTKNETINWKIFSLYRTNVTNDYLDMDFDTDEEYANFINMLKSRSVYNFETEVTTNDKILTLSSCVGTSQRVVIHAVRINE